MKLIEYPPPSGLYGSSTARLALHCEVPCGQATFGEVSRVLETPIPPLSHWDLIPVHVPEHLPLLEIALPVQAPVLATEPPLLAGLDLRQPPAPQALNAEVLRPE